MVLAKVRHAAKAVEAAVDSVVATNLHGEERRRARLVVATSSALAVLAVFFGGLGIVTGLPLLARDLALLATLMAMTTVVAPRRPRVAAVVTVAAMFGILWKFVYDFNGLESSALMWLPVLALLSANTLGPRAGVATGVLVAIGAIGVWVGTHSGFVFPAPITEEVNQLFLAAGCGGIALFLGGVGWVSERDRISHAASLESANAALGLENTRRRVAERALQVEVRASQVSARATGVLDAAPDLARLLCEGLGFDGGMVWTRHGAELRLAATYASTESLHGALEQLDDVRFAVGEGSRAVWLTDGDSDGDGVGCATWAGGLSRFGAVSAVSAPFALGGEVYAVVALLSRLPRNDGDAVLQTLELFRAPLDLLEQRSRMEQERRIMERQTQEARRQETLARLAAGAAHEINTPLQFISDNLAYLERSSERSMAILAQVRSVVALARAGVVDAATLDVLEAAMGKARFEQMSIQAPRAAASAREGAAQVARIVDEMKKITTDGDDRSLDLHVVLPS